MYNYISYIRNVLKDDSNQLDKNNQNKITRKITKYIRVRKVNIIIEDSASAKTTQRTPFCE